MKRLGLRVKLPEDLENQYDLHQARSARWRIVAALLSLLVLTVGSLFSDARVGILSTALFWKLTVQAPALLIGILVVCRQRKAPGYLWVAGAVPFTISIAVFMMLADATPSPFCDRFVTMAGLTAFAANLALPVKFRVAVPMSLLNIAVYIGIPFALVPLSHALGYIDILLFFSAMILIASATTHKRERMQKETFLLMLTKDQQTEELMVLVNELTQISYRDPLTGAGNRRSFDMRFSALWRNAAMHREAIALIMIDVDHFKLYNDSIGHSAGDTCLRAVAEAIARGADCPIEKVARYGGEEFALVLQSTDGSIAESIRASVEALKLPHPGLPLGGIVTVSVGKAFTFPSYISSDQDDLIRAADDALYAAKRLGRNRIVIADRKMVAVA